MSGRWAGFADFEVCDERRALRRADAVAMSGGSLDQIQPHSNATFKITGPAEHPGPECGCSPKQMPQIGTFAPQMEYNRPVFRLW